MWLKVEVWTEVWVDVGMDEWVRGGVGVRYLVGKELEGLKNPMSAWWH